MKCRLRTKNETDAKTVVEDWGPLTWLAGAQLTGGNLTVGRVAIKKGRENPRHCHDSCEEVLYLLQGRMTLSMGDGPDPVEMEAGDTLYIPAGVLHKAYSTGDVDADMIVSYSSGTRDFRVEE